MEKTEEVCSLFVPTNKAAEIILAYAAKKKRKTLLAYLGISESTFLSRLRNPGSFKLAEIAALQRCLRIPNESILAIINLLSERS